MPRSAAGRVGAEPDLVGFVGLQTVQHHDLTVERGLSDF
jgi:hypothetical protein